METISIKKDTAKAMFNRLLIKRISIAHGEFFRLCADWIKKEYNKEYLTKDWDSLFFENGWKVREETLCLLEGYVNLYFRIITSEKMFSSKEVKILVETNPLYGDVLLEILFDEMNGKFLTYPWDNEDNEDDE